MKPMKLMKRISAVLLLLLLLAALSGCYVISPQRMWRVKGTYRLTGYTVTPSHERREGYTPRTYDYVAGEDYLYEDYLVITAEGRGYYVHKAKDAPATVQEIGLSYTYNSEDSSKVDYVTLGGLTIISLPEGAEKLGVTRDNLGYSKPGINYTEPFTGKEKTTESISVRFERVNRATDLSYVEKQLGALEAYGQ